jgi:hypothetical protein
MRKINFAASVARRGDKRSMSGKFGLIGLVILSVFIFGNFYLQLTGGPSRTQSARLEPFGDINVHLQTQPDPPKTGGIPLIVHITDAAGKSMSIDRVDYAYALSGGLVNQLSGDAMDAGTFQAVAALTEVGEWQVRVTLFKGSQRTQVTFLLRVMANI